MIAPFWQVAALIPNLYGLQEYVYTRGQKAPSWHSEIKCVNGKIEIPERDGLGIDYDEAVWKDAERF